MRRPGSRSNAPLCWLTSTIGVPFRRCAAPFACSVGIARFPVCRGASVRLLSRPRRYHMSISREPFENDDHLWRRRIDGNNDGEYRGALENLFIEALRSYYEGNPVLTDGEFKTLRDELEHLGSSSLRLNDLEKVWIQAAQQRDMDRRLLNELRLSPEELDGLKAKLGASRTSTLDMQSILKSDSSMDKRLMYLLFGDAVEDRFKLLLLYAPAVLLCLSSILGFALLDLICLGHIQLTFDDQVAVRASVLFVVIAVVTAWFSNYLTPRMLSYLDLGSPEVVRGPCPNCGNDVTCLFSSASDRKRDERRCKRCGAIVGFNVAQRKVFLVARPQDRKKLSAPD
jgi:hypothetical protein